MVNKATKSQWAGRFFIIWIALLWIVSGLHLFTGIPDNGDFSRAYSFLLEKPYGWVQDVPAFGSADWDRRFFYVWMDKWQIYPEFSNLSNPYTYSSQKLWMLAQFASSVLLTGSQSVYSVIAASIIGRLVFLSGFTAIFFLVRKNLGGWSGLVYLLFSTPLILSSGFVAFLNSFFEEQVLVIWLPMMVFLVYAGLSSGLKRYVIAAIIIALFIGASKPAYFLLPVFVSLTLWKAVGARQAVIIAALCLLIALMPAITSPNKGVNQYHALYRGALMVLHENGVSIDAIGEKPVLQQCIGETAFSANGAECVSSAHASYADFVKVLLIHPTLGPRMVWTALEAGNRTEVSRSGLNPESGPTFASAPLFNAWSYAYGYRANLVILLVGIGCVGLSIFRRIEPLSVASTMLVAWGASQYVMALADGFIELDKHLLGANYALSIAAVLYLSVLMSHVMRRVG